MLPLLVRREATSTMAINITEHIRESLMPDARFFLAIEKPDTAPDVIKAISEPIAIISIGFLRAEIITETKNEEIISERKENKTPSTRGESLAPRLFISLLFFIKKPPNKPTKAYSEFFCFITCFLR